MTDEKQNKETEQNETKDNDHKKEVEQESNREEKIMELTDSLQRLQAEFENYKKYVEKERADTQKYAKAGLMGTLLPVVDAFSMALTQTKDPQKFIEGMKLIHDQIMLTFENEGMAPIEAIGKEFDPHLHEVMMKKPSDEKEGTIIDEVQKGFMLHDKVLRHSKVIVSEGKKADSTDKQETAEEQPSEEQKE